MIHSHIPETVTQHQSEADQLPPDHLFIDPAYIFRWHEKIKALKNSHNMSSQWKNRQIQNFSKLKNILKPR